MRSKLRHVIDAHDFDPTFLEELFASTNALRPDASPWNGNVRKWKQDMYGQLSGYLMYSLFYEPSTRTRFSFETAADILGMRVRASENAGQFSSRAKGESDQDAVKVLSSYHPDIIVIRHDEADTLLDIAKVSSAPIINAGDGGGQHPTQSLLDMYTIQHELGRLRDLTIVMGGDLRNGRTVRSLAYLLAKFPGNTLIFVAPPGLEMRPDIKDYLKRKKVAFHETQDLDDAIQDADVVYWTRIQKERLTPDVEYADVARQFRITNLELARMKPKSILMHPLPRVKEGFIDPKDGEELINELAEECDTDPRAAYFRQAQNGLYVRMALLKWVLGSK